MLLAFVIVAQAADILTLAIGVPVVGINAEANPLARSLYLHWGIMGDVALKVVAVAFMVAILAVYRGTERRRRVLAALAGGVGLFGAFFNVVAIVGH
jgi:hypothetical protein